MAIDEQLERSKETIAFRVSMRLSKVNMEAVFNTNVTKILERYAFTYDLSTAETKNYALVCYPGLLNQLHT